MFQLLQKKLRTSVYSLLVDAFKARIYCGRDTRYLMQARLSLLVFGIQNTLHEIGRWGIEVEEFRGWNKALTAKTSWKIHLKKDSLTIKWISHVHSHFPNVWLWTWHKDH